MNSLQIRQLVIIRVDARAEEEACVPSVHDLVIAELDEVALVLLVAGRDEAVDLERADVNTRNRGWRGWLTHLAF
jgi:hypothetical protein